MTVHKEISHSVYSAQQLFELIAEVERYPEFLPLWREVHVSKSVPTDLGSIVYFTNQVLRIGPLRKRFRTKTTLQEFRSIHVSSDDSLFRKFIIDWRLSAEKKGGCRIDFSLDCVASSPLLRPVFEVVLSEAARTIVSSFENRARSIYGK